MNGIHGGNFAGLKQHGSKSAAEIAFPSAACGIIIDVMTKQTSLAIILSKVIAILGVNNLFVALGFIDPNWVSTIAALAVGIALMAWLIISTKKAQTAAA